MPKSIKHIVACGWLCAAVLVSAACAPKRIPPMTVTDLMEDRVTLDGVLMKCNENPERARSSSDCLNARVAVERLAKDVDPAEEAKRNVEFERSREKLRLAQEKQRQEQDEKTKVDAYDLPLVPVDPAAQGGTAPSSTAPGGALPSGASPPGAPGGTLPSGASPPGIAQIRP
ncbi:MAG: EexN family lipoprotein [Steroidobacteraceae bacterium]|jgi:hypothetical protein